MEDRGGCSTDLQPSSAILPFVLKFLPMADDSALLAASRMARWVALVGLIAFAVVLYFRDGRRLLPLTATPPAAATDRPAN